MVFKATAVRNVRLQTGTNTSCIVSLPVNQPHPQTGLQYNLHHYSYNNSFYSTKEMTTKNLDDTSIATASVTSMMADNQDAKPLTKTDSVLGSDDSLLDDKV